MISLTNFLNTCNNFILQKQCLSLHSFSLADNRELLYHFNSIIHTNPCDKTANLQYNQAKNGLIYYPLKSG